MTMSTSRAPPPQFRQRSVDGLLGAMVCGSIRDHLAASRMPVSTRILRPPPSIAADQIGTSSTVPSGYP